ncbi:hypothetical protein LOTGIDRAFT_153687 [Lottia gigantea]|uniref:Uncharacterized protein n=1 Tax=Lottia gigantea TaxID=225164 RepID=V4AD48_LOTGI|nr:hypothetical protein LOTGIDRAFT_153687 [Lottia gigantea]ESO91256.1 hypothetical protein LOTGIDRAFT_153687 [Lottia gigantea]
MGDKSREDCPFRNKFIQLSAISHSTFIQSLSPNLGTSPNLPLLSLNPFSGPQPKPRTRTKTNTTQEHLEEDIGGRDDEDDDCGYRVELVNYLPTASSRDIPVINEDLTVVPDHEVTQDNVDRPTTSVATPDVSDESEVSDESSARPPRRSDRSRRTPARFTDYVMSQQQSLSPNLGTSPNLPLLSLNPFSGVFIVI